MANTLRQQIVTALSTRLQAITTAGGYNTQIGTKVDEWRNDYEAIVAEEMPRLNFKDVNDQKAGITMTPSFERRLTVLIEGFVQADTTGTSASAASRARALLGDIEKVLYTDQTLGGLCKQITMVGDQPILVGQLRKTVAAVDMTIEIEYHTTGNDPYTNWG